MKILALSLLFITLVACRVEPSIDDLEGQWQSGCSSYFSDPNTAYFDELAAAIYSQLALSFVDGQLRVELTEYDDDNCTTVEVTFGLVESHYYVGDTLVNEQGERVREIDLVIIAEGNSEAIAKTVYTIENGILYLGAFVALANGDNRILKLERDLAFHRVN